VGAWMFARARATAEGRWPASDTIDEKEMFALSLLLLCLSFHDEPTATHLTRHRPPTRPRSRRPFLTAVSTTCLGTVATAQLHDVPASKRREALVEATPASPGRGIARQAARTRAHHARIRACPRLHVPAMIDGRLRSVEMVFAGSSPPGTHRAVANAPRRVGTDG